MATILYFQRAKAAFFAISERFSLESFSRLAVPPAFPLRIRPDIGGSASSSPVAIFATIMAQPITSAGRFSPRGPVGIGEPFSYISPPYIYLWIAGIATFFVDIPQKLILGHISKWNAGIRWRKLGLAIDIGGKAKRQWRVVEHFVTRSQNMPSISCHY
jgi:hypothetical protein